MNSFLIWPYEETEFQVNKTEQIFSLKAPWLRSSFRIPSGERLVYEQAIAITTHAPSPKSLAIVKDAFFQISHYPFFYFLPRQDLLSDKVVKNIIWPTPHKDHPWDKKAALELAKVSTETFDPVTLISILRRYYLLELKQQIKEESIFTIISRFPDFERSRKGLAIVLRQLHYMYERVLADCQEATSLHRDCSTNVALYIEKAKKGAQVLNLSLGTMDYTPEEIVVSEQTKVLAEKMIEMSKQDLLGFSFIADMLEQSFLPKERPLAEILRDNGFWHSVNEVQEQLTKFSLIGNNEALKIVLGMGAVPESVAKKTVDKAYEHTLMSLEILKERYSSF